MRSLTTPILALARAGAGERAWEAFAAAGLDHVDDDPATLCLKGRLLKDAAHRALGAERNALLAQAADAYAAAAALAPATYPLINAATLALLAGDTARAAHLATETLALLDSGAHEPDTLYWLGATRAEALLLLGREAEAQAALRRAVDGTPRAWEDHAVTLRQFRLILSERRRPADWLDAFRLPPAAHFAGPIGIGASDAKLERAIEEAVITLRPGSATGALAAGFDIVASEILLRHNVQLHLLLPGSVADFIEVSVRPFGMDWVARFERVAADAAMIETIAEDAGPCAGSVILAEEMALGCAVREARMRDAETFLLRMARAPRPGDARSGLRAVEVAGGAIAEPHLPLLPALPAKPVAILGCGRDLVEALADHGAAPVRAFAGGTYAVFDDLAEAAALLTTLHAAAPHAALGLDYGLAGEGDPDVTRLEALLHMPARGYPLATRAAALALDSRPAGFKTAIAGESATGAEQRFEFFSLWSNDPPITPPGHPAGGAN